MGGTKKGESKEAVLTVRRSSSAVPAQASIDLLLVERYVGGKQGLTHAHVPVLGAT
jgi:hypothetical protein